MILLELFLSFLQVGAFSVGGGYAAIPFIQSLAVDTHHWLTLNEFTNLVTIAEMTPGPIALNAATFVGARVGGFWGAIIASVGVVAPSLVIVTLLSILYTRSRGGRTMQTVLGALRAVVVALIASAAISLARAACMAGGTVFVAGAVLLIAALAVLRLTKCSPILVLTACGLLGAAMHALGLL